MAKPFICKDERGLAALRYWLKNEVDDFNVINDLNCRHDGKPDIRLGWDDKPDSDWGKWTPKGLIICSSEEVRAQAVAVCERELSRRNKAMRRAFP